MSKPSSGRSYFVSYVVVCSRREYTHGRESARGTNAARGDLSNKTAERRGGEGNAFIYRIATREKNVFYRVIVGARAVQVFLVVNYYYTRFGFFFF